jgi:hypothetical protein
MAGGVIGGGVVIDGAVGTRLKVSFVVGNGDGASNDSGLAASRGLIVLLGSGLGVDVGDAFGFTVDVGDGFGFAVGVGVSSAAPGVLARNGVDAASCPRTNVAVTRSAIAKTNRRMISVFSVKILAGTLACACPVGQEQYPRTRIPAAAGASKLFPAHDSIRWTRPRLTSNCPTP